MGRICVWPQKEYKEGQWRTFNIFLSLELGFKKNCKKKQKKNKQTNQKQKTNKQNINKTKENKKQTNKT